MIPANAFLGFKETLVSARELFRKLIWVFRVEKSAEGMSDQQSERRVDMPLVIQRSKTFQCVFEQSLAGGSVAV